MLSVIFSRLAPQALLYANSDNAFRHIATLTAGVNFLPPLHGSEFQSGQNRGLVFAFCWLPRRHRPQPGRQRREPDGDAATISSDAERTLYYDILLLQHIRDQLFEEDSNTVTRLEKIPAGLQPLYQQLFDTALQQDEDPETIKQFVMVARHPLSTRELASACDLYQDEGEEGHLNPRQRWGL
ncbi:hypothetical protein CMUS01_15746 [Colletotrichum musicola]|uniref:Uncharacterized protein n=2 Tax=Colletotrichum orchidearum species complex TaxID=2707337 RepID=A0A8H6ITY2_9PEZI|nr:hypothetical protein CSOJ01_15250 [Colletotrichum sojae]KAF6798142.1 hypothetical protein CMUS01_15746 [Colletotrichum musicola]